VRSPSPPHAPAVVAACGLEAEARIAQGPRVRTVLGGGQAALLRTRLAAAVAAGGVAGIASFGIAGGLDAGLRPGTLVIASWIAGPRRRWIADPRWVEALEQICSGAVTAGIEGSDAPVASVEEKQRLNAVAGAAAVDMESHIVAEIAHGAGLPFAAIRVVADAADKALPPAALVPLRADGKPDLPRVLAAVAGDPRQLPALIRVARDTATALASLRRIRRQLGLGLACPDLLELVLDMP